MTVFCVQDDTGTVAQFTLASAPSGAIVVGDTGTVPNANGDNLPFIVGQVLDTTRFGVTTANASASDWPQTGTITWTTGANANTTSVLDAMDGANAYETVAELTKYLDTRGMSYINSPVSALQQAIVRATDYLDQKYRYKGIKLVQKLGNPIIDPTMAFLDPFLSPFGIGSIPFMAPATSTQKTEWPRQGLVDFNGDEVYGIPATLKAACSELAFRSLGGTALQPDYDPNLVGNGGIVQSIDEQVGPIRTSKTFDTKLGIGFFPSFPQVDRMLSKAGYLIAAGGRTIIR